jgi:hypothetical protein
MHGAAAARPKPSAKLLERYAEGDELHEAKEMGWVVLREHAPLRMSIQHPQHCIEDFCA